MIKFIKFTYYNGVIVFFIWLIVLLYKINFWLTVIGTIIMIFLFIYFTPKIIKIINEYNIDLGIGLNSTWTFYLFCTI